MISLQLRWAILFIFCLLAPEGMYSIIFRYTINYEYPLSKNVYNFQGSMSLFLWLCFFITYLTLPLNLYWKQFVSTCDIVIIDSRMPRRSWSTNTFCANARRYRHQATPSHIFYLIHAFQGLLQHLFVCIAYFHWTFNYYLP